MDKNAKDAICNDLINLAKETRTEDCKIIIIEHETGVAFVDFIYNWAEGMFTMFDFLQTFMWKLDLSNKKSCEEFLNELKNKMDFRIHNSDFKRTELKRWWKEHYEFDQTQATKCAVWLWDVYPKVYKTFENWIDKYSTYDSVEQGNVA